MTQFDVDTIAIVLIFIVGVIWITRRLIKDWRLFNRNRLLMEHTQSLSDFSDDLRRTVNKEIGEDTYLRLLFSIDRTVALFCCMAREKPEWFGEDGVYSESFLHQMKNLLDSMRKRKAIDARIGEIEDKFAKILFEHEARARKGK
jgi:hypothetical protein